MTTLSVFVLFTATCVLQQRRGNSLLHFHRKTISGRKLIIAFP